MYLSARPVATIYKPVFTGRAPGDTMELIIIPKVVRLRGRLFERRSRLPMVTFSLSPLPLHRLPLPLAQSDDFSSSIIRPRKRSGKPFYEPVSMLESTRSPVDAALKIYRGKFSSFLFDIEATDEERIFRYRANDL